MSKPADYRETYVLTVDVPYRNAAKQSSESHASVGILQQGRVVWSQSGSERGDSVSVYAEGVGLIDLPTDVLSQTAARA